MSPETEWVVVQQPPARAKRVYARMKDRYSDEGMYQEPVFAAFVGREAHTGMVEP